MSNLHVINSRKGHCRASAIISKRGKNYKIERQTVKKENRSGKLSVTTHLNLFEVDIHGDILRDLCGEQRRETEKTLRDIIGSPEDFLLTAFASQGEMNTFLKQKGSSRKSVLSKFLELDVFDHLYEIVEVAGKGNWCGYSDFRLIDLSGSWKDTKPRWFIRNEKEKFVSVLVKYFFPIKFFL